MNPAETDRYNVVRCRQDKCQFDHGRRRMSIDNSVTLKHTYVGVHKVKNFVFASWNGVPYETSPIKMVLPF